MAGPLLKIQFTSAPEIKKAMEKMGGVVRPAMAAGLYQLGCAVVSDSIPRAPKDTGTLRNSAYCSLPQGSGDSVSVQGGYGGFAKGYALVQHENLTYRHAEGGPKYLERSFQKFAPGAAQWLAEFMAKAMESGSRPPLNSGGIRTEPGGKGADKPRRQRQRAKQTHRQTSRRRPGRGRT